MSSCKNKGSQAPKCHACDNVSVAIEAINAVMRRKGIGLGDMYHAVNMLIDKAVNDVILRMRAEGRSIREIARFVHMDDSRVSRVIKEAYKCEHKGKPCKSCKR